MKQVFTRDEIVAGVNDNCAPDYRVVPAGGQRSRSTTNAAAKFQAAVKAAQVNAKLDEVIGLLKRQAAKDAAWGPREKAAWESRPVPSAPGVLSPYEMVRQFNNASAPQMAQKCAELKAAYDARNPHKQKEVAV